MAGRQYKSTNYLSVWDSNTICDATGFKVKTSQVVRRWEGFYLIPAAFNPRQKEDFPITAIQQQVYKNARVQQSNPPETAQPLPDIV